MPALTQTPVYNHTFFGENSTTKKFYDQSPSVETPYAETGPFKRTWTSLVVEPGMLKRSADQINKFGTTNLGHDYNKKKKRETGVSSGTGFMIDPYILPRNKGFVSDKVIHYVPGMATLTDPYCSAPQTMDLEPAYMLPNADDLNRIKDLKKTTIKNDLTNNALSTLYDVASKEKVPTPTINGSLPVDYVGDKTITPTKLSEQQPQLENQHQANPANDNQSIEGSSSAQNLLSSAQNLLPNVYNNTGKAIDYMPVCTVTDPKEGKQNGANNVNIDKVKKQNNGMNSVKFTRFGAPKDN
jgi:hypothetical protein